MRTWICKFDQTDHPGGESGTFGEISSPDHEEYRSKNKFLSSVLGLQGVLKCTSHAEKSISEIKPLIAVHRERYQS